uniref:Uncharacterized protein n=1 Tax=viral metagenome TaxID=1070528 RepID=A0A6M3LRD5_9ZZZZ
MKSEAETFYVTMVEATENDRTLQALDEVCEKLRAELRERSITASTIIEIIEDLKTKRTAEIKVEVEKYMDGCCQVANDIIEDLAPGKAVTIEIYDADGNEVDPKHCMIQRNSIMRVADGEEVEHDTDLYIIRLPFATESHLWTQAWREKRENYKGR